MKCITTPAYSLMITGKLRGFFKGGKGLRQGDPISPLLFVLYMEYLSRIFNYVCRMPNFKFFKCCKELQLCPLCFADDLILFYEGDFYSIFTLLHGFENFSATSGLVANREKVELFAGNMDNDILRKILCASGYKLGQLPFRYLGVPITARSFRKHSMRLL